MLSKIVGTTTPRDSVLHGIHRPAAATAAVITLTGVTGLRHFVHYIAWSYSDNPTGGKLTVTNGAVVDFEVDITTGGPGGLGVALVGDSGATVVVTLASGGGTVVGKVNAQYTTESDASK